MSTAKVYRPLKGRTQIRLPYQPGGGNYALLKEVCGEATRPKYEKPIFTVARNHTTAVIDGLAERFDRVEVTLEGNAYSTCVSECWEKAKPETVADCVCGCAGRNHGTGEPEGAYTIAPGLVLESEVTTYTYVIE
ncbi:hypothetical protein WBN73_20935 [Paenarthrobacter sp. CCNWLY172]|uniref:hypothetical protein n=1 Tax=unclassified Paenarthrobacter TaxID=2634190 RepID=UPI003078942F